MSAEPILYRWLSGAMVPLPRFGNRCGAEFEEGRTYRLVEVEERSEKSHRQFFASIRHAWENLPEEAAIRFATPDALRKFALIRTGYRDERSIACANKAEARRIAAFIRPLDEFAVVTVSDALVTVYTAKSQSTKAMGRADFQKSKQAVLDYVAAMIGVEPEQLSAQAKESVNV